MTLAGHELIAHQVVSFAVYQIEDVVQALIAAGCRGVRLRICLEAPEPGGQRVAYDTIRALGDDVGRLAQLYIWPRDQRALCACADPLLKIIIPQKPDLDHFLACRFLLYS